MRLSKADAQLLQAVQELKRLLSQQADDRQLALFLRGLPKLNRASNAVISFLPGTTPISVDVPVRRRKAKGVLS